MHHGGNAPHRLIFIAILALSFAACGGNSATAPSSAPSSATPTTTRARITINFLPTGAPLGWSATFQGSTMSTAGSRGFDLAAGQYTISGTTTLDAQGFGGALVISFSSTTLPSQKSGGGVQLSLIHI